MARPYQDLTQSTAVPQPGDKYFVSFERGQKLFELSNHLGNVLVTVSDKRISITQTENPKLTGYYMPEVVSAADYYPYGMVMPGRDYASTGYVYGFNGKRKLRGLYGEDNAYDYGMRIYDSRVGRFLSVDPLTPKYPELTPYQFASNRPIDGVDRDGLEYSQSNKYGPIESSSTKLYPMHPALMLQTNAKIEQVQAQRRVPIIAPDMYGNGHMGPRWLVEQNITSIRQKYVSAVGDNISGGPFGAIGYIWKGERGSFAGAAVDQVMYSFGGLDQKGYLSRPQTVEPEKNIPNRETPSFQSILRTATQRTANRIGGLRNMSGNYKAYFFGSRNNGSNSISSDQDVLILTDNLDFFKSEKGMVILNSIQTDYKKATGLELDINIMTNQQYRRTNGGKFKESVDANRTEIKVK